MVERDFEDAGDLCLAGHQRDVGGHGGEHRRHREAGDGAIGGQRADDGDQRRGQRDFLLGLAQGGGDGILARVGAPAGKGDLSRMVAQRVGALRQDHAGTRAVGDRDQHRRLRQVRIATRFGIAVIASEQRGLRSATGAEGGGKPRGKAHAVMSSAKKAPLLQMPGRSPSASARSASS